MTNMELFRIASLIALMVPVGTVAGICGYNVIFKRNEHRNDKIELSDKNLKIIETLEKLKHEYLTLAAKVFNMTGV